jgi:hypothetical protein
MAKDYNNPLDQMKAISYNLKRVADALEGIEEKLTNNTPKTLSDTYQFKPVSKKTIWDDYVYPSQDSNKKETVFDKLRRLQK